MDVETVNTLHRLMKKAETAWLDSSTRKHGKVVNGAETKVLWKKYMDAFRDWHDAAKQLEREESCQTIQ